MNPVLVTPWRALLAAVLALGLTGCATLTGLVGQARVDVLGGAVTVAAPTGYCVGPGEVEQGEDSAVVLIGRCISTGMVTPAVISVSVGHAASAGVLVAGDEALAGFFASPEGRALLARSGDAADVTLIETRADGDAFLMHVNDRMAGNYWRAILGLGGRLVTISATGTGRMALTPEASLKAVTQTIRSLRGANPVAAPIAVAAPDQPLVDAPVIPPDSATQPPPARPTG